MFNVWPTLFQKVYTKIIFFHHGLGAFWKHRLRDLRDKPTLRRTLLLYVGRYYYNLFDKLHNY